MANTGEYFYLNILVNGSAIVEFHTVLEGHCSVEPVYTQKMVKNGNILDTLYCVKQKSDISIIVYIPGPTSMSSAGRESVFKLR